MMLAIRKLGIALSLLIVLVPAGDGMAYPQRPSGVDYRISGGTISIGSSDSLSLQVPEPYQVIHIENSHGRLLVTAYSVVTRPGDKLRFHSEVWMFETNGATKTALDFDDRKILVEFETSDGESKQLCRRTLSSASTIAVYVDGWENGRTLLFDKEGAPIEVEWPKIKAPGDQCCVDFILPVVWIEEYSPQRRSRLVCRMNDHGDMDPYLLVFDPQARTFENLPMSKSLGAFGETVVNAMLRQVGAY